MGKALSDTPSGAVLAGYIPSFDFTNYHFCHDTQLGLVGTPNYNVVFAPLRFVCVARSDG